MFPFISGDGVANVSVAFGTRIRAVLGGGIGFTHAVNLSYSDTGTAHTLTLMRGASRTKAAGSVAAAGTSLVTVDKLLDGDGNDIATSDVIAAQLDNGAWHQTTVSALDSAKTTITLVNAVPTGRTIPDGTKVVNYGVAGDAMHSKQQYLSGSATSAVNIPAVAGGVMSLCKATAAKEPIILDSNNATATGTLNYANVGQTLQ